MISIFCRQLSLDTKPRECVIEKHVGVFFRKFITICSIVSLSRWNFPKIFASPKVAAINDISVYWRYWGFFEVITVRESWTWNCGGPWRRRRKAFLCAVPWSNTSDTARTQAYNIFCNQSIDCFGYSKLCKAPQESRYVAERTSNYMVLDNVTPPTPTV